MGSILSKCKVKWNIIKTMKKFNMIYERIMESINKPNKNHIKRYDKNGFKIILRHGRFNGYEIFIDGPRCKNCPSERTIEKYIYFKDADDRFEKLKKDFLNKINENECKYSLSEIEHLLSNKKVAKLISDIKDATSESNYMKALRIFSGVTLNDIDLTDQLVGYSADKLHYHQRLDSNVCEYLNALEELTKN